MTERIVCRKCNKYMRGIMYRTLQCPNCKYEIEVEDDTDYG